MKKFIIAMLCVAVLFGFAACDNSSSNPAEDDSSTSVPVTEATQMRSAAGYINNWLYGNNKVIDVAAIIDNADIYNAAFANGELTITETYPAGGSKVGTVTVVLSGQYSEPTASDDGSLDVDDYTVSATDLQILEGTDYSTVSFTVTAPVTGVTVKVNKSTGSWTKSGTATIYAPLPDQNASATLPVTVAYDSEGKAIKESKTFGDGLVTVLTTLNTPATGAAENVKYVEGVAKTYLAELKTSFAAALADGGDINTLLFGTAEEKAKIEDLTASIVNNVATENQKGTVVLTVTADEYAFTTGKTISGTLTFTFDGTRSGTTVTLSSLEITGSCTLAGGDYVLEVVSDEDFPVSVETLSGCNVTVDAQTVSKVTKITATGFANADLTGRASIEGITFTLPANN